MRERIAESLSRPWVEIAAAMVVIAIPVVLIAATWEPLEPFPRDGQSLSVDGEQTPLTRREERRRERRGEPPRGVASPPSAPLKSAPATAAVTPPR